MKHTTTKLALAAFAASIIGSGAALAGPTMSRIDHGNGQPTFIYGPQSNGPVASTIGIYANGRSVGTDTSSGVVRLDHSNGRPTFIYAPQSNGPVGTR